LAGEVLCTRDSHRLLGSAIHRSDFRGLVFGHEVVTRVNSLILQWNGR
jgi:hypothetical protein